MVIFVSQVIILVVGTLVVGLAGWGVFAPEKLMTFVTAAMDKDWGIFVAVLTRLVLGATLIIVAPTSHFPNIFQALGLIAVAAAIALSLMGRERIRRFIAWWSERFSAGVVRLWLLFGMAFGGFLIYGVV